jgi:hypothetical protein
MSIVRKNLMTIMDYTPYCGNNLSRYNPKGCNNPRTIWSKEKEQFYCPRCFWTSTFDDEFIKGYKTKWEK